jgi:TIR domain
VTHDVFICHSSMDRTIANAICSKLEQNHIRCWIAPRDVLPGRDFAECIIEAISGSKLTVLVFSDNSNQSLHVHREIERAVAHGIPILPFRVEDVIPSPSLEYFISNAHWLDAMTPPMEQHLDHLVGTIRLLLEHEGEAAASEVVPEPAASPQHAPLPTPDTHGPSAPPTKLPTWWRWGVLGAIAVVGIIIAGASYSGAAYSGAAYSGAAATAGPRDQ